MSGTNQISKTKEFRFQRARYLVELTGQRASNLREFVNILQSADPSSIFYHLYHPLFEAHLVPYEYPNDFSYWFSDSLQDNDLAEQVANIELPTDGLEELRQILVSKLAGFVPREDGFKTHPGNEFHFVRCRFIVYPEGTVARNLDELVDGMSTASEPSFFYHMVTSRLFRKSKYDDFSLWIIENTDQRDLAEHLRRVDPTTHMSVKGMQREALAVVQNYLKTKNHIE